MRAALGFAAWLPLMGCYQIESASGYFQCAPPDNACPAGQACVDGRCQARTDEVRPPPDLADALDQAPGSAACRGPGTLLQQQGGAEVHACLGTFAAAGAAGLCRAGYHLCADADQALLLGLLREGRCDGLRGFFAAATSGSLRLADRQFLCQPAPDASAVGVLLGCGREVGVTDAPGPLCLGLRQSMRCDQPASGWSCARGLADAERGGAAPGGVLCCR